MQHIYFLQLTQNLPLETKVQLPPRWPTRKHIPAPSSSPPALVCYPQIYLNNSFKTHYPKSPSYTLHTNTSSLFNARPCNIFIPCNLHRISPYRQKCNSLPDGPPESIYRPFHLSTSPCLLSTNSLKPLTQNTLPQITLLHTTYKHKHITPDHPLTHYIQTHRVCLTRPHTIC